MTWQALIPVYVSLAGLLITAIWNAAIVTSMVRDHETRLNKNDELFAQLVNDVIVLKTKEELPHVQHRYRS